MIELQGKTVVISGGAEGIGLEIGLVLGRRGMNVVLADIDTQNLAAARDRMAAENIATLTVELDVALEEHWQKVAGQTLERFGKVHMLVNNAGVGGAAGAIESYDSASWRWAIDVNLMGVVYGAQTFVPLIKQHGEGGWLLNVASMAGIGGVPYMAAYSATKNAVVALSEGWSTELEEHGVKVAVLCPGFVKTRIHESHRNRQARYAVDKAPSKQQQKIADGAREAVQNGIDVELLGKRVMEALDGGEFYIFTHPSYRQLARPRAAAIDAAVERAAASPLLKDILEQEIGPF